MPHAALARRRRPTAAVTACMALLVLGTASVAATGSKGGGPCTLNVQCGWPAGNVDSLRDQASSLTGQCTDGTCECYSIYGCQTCAVIEIPSEGTTRSVAGGGTVDLCNMPWGGGVCTEDVQCGAGVCLDNRCVCYKDWACEYCSLDLSQDILNGAQCGQYTSGNGACSSDGDCNTPFGVCRNGRCQCGSGYACAHCDQPKQYLIAGQRTCPCDKVSCSGHGNCHNGNCICSDGFAGAYCDFDPCEGITCSGHGSCSRSTGKCTCDEGFNGDDCGKGGAYCEEDKHCGIFGTNKFGGSCNEEGECECWEGFTCQDCAGLGDTCDEATGGGPCESEWDCGVFESGFGGQCVMTDDDKYWITQGRCRCWPGLTCQQCNVKVSDREAGAPCPAPLGNSATRSSSASLAAAAGAAAVVTAAVAAM